MKVKVVKRYVDRCTKDIKEVGTVEDYLEERARELISGGYAEAVKGKSPAKIKSAGEWAHPHKSR